ncbi:MAG: DUF4097 family beta strand repeat-containing protein [Cyclobacteriaceae bacterium]
MKKLKAIFVMVGLVTGIVSVSGQERITKKFTGIDEIEISVSSGDAIFKKSSNNEVSVELVHTFNIEYVPSFRQSGSKLDIDDKEAGGRYNSYSGSATWTFYIPDNINVEFETGSGDAEIAGLSLEFEMSSGSGDFDITNSKGEIEIKTGSGDIDVRNVEGDLEFSTGSGDIELGDVVASIKASTGSGSVDADDIEISERSSFSSGSGDVAVTLAKTPDFDLSVSSGSGDATLDFNGNQMEGVVVMQINKERGRIRAPFDFDSEEELGEGRNTRLKKTKKFSDKDIRISVRSGSGTAEINK